MFTKTRTVASGAPIPYSDDGIDSPSENDSTRSLTIHPPFFLRPAVLMFLLLTLFACNVFLYIQNRRLTLAVNDEGFTGVYARGRTWKQFRTYTDYSNINQSISDAAWGEFTTNGFVAIPHNEAADFSLPSAQNFPDNPSKGIYVLSGFHELHCVIYLRNTIISLQAGKSVDENAIHINHCYDTLRQAIQCRADDTPLYTPYRSRLTGDGQFRLCRDWNALTSWAQDHSACWPTGRCNLL